MRVGGWEGVVVEGVRDRGPKLASVAKILYLST